MMRHYVYGLMGERMFASYVHGSHVGPYVGWRRRQGYTVYWRVA